jgi:hypothetical protein
VRGKLVRSSPRYSVRTSTDLPSINAVGVGEIVDPFRYRRVAETGMLGDEHASRCRKLV